MTLNHPKNLQSLKLQPFQSQMTRAKVSSQTSANQAVIPSLRIFQRRRSQSRRKVALVRPPDLPQMCSLKVLKRLHFMTMKGSQKKVKQIGRSGGTTWWKRWCRTTKMGLGSPSQTSSWMLKRGGQMTPTTTLVPCLFLTTNGRIFLLEWKDIGKPKNRTSIKLSSTGLDLGSSSTFKMQLNVLSMSTWLSLRGLEMIKLASIKAWRISILRYWLTKAIRSQYVNKQRQQKWCKRE